MPRAEDVFTIFLASPADVLEERNRFEESINDWNRAWARNLGLRLEILRWEDDAYPGVGEDPQEVINRQIPDDYDLFVGLMWSRFGTPTGRAGSGTAEEFERARRRHASAPGSVGIFFYFKDTPIPPSKLDPAQLLKVQEFKQSLGNEGVLYWDFSDADQFDRLVALHISKHVQNWRKQRQEGNPRVRVASPSAIEQVDVTSAADFAPSDDDPGYLDLLDTFTQRAGEVSEIALRLSEAQNELTARMSQRTREIDDFAAASPGPTAGQAKRLIARAADDMLQFTKRVEAEVPLFRSAIDGCIDALTKAATILVDLNKEQTRSSKKAAIGLLASLSGARHSVIEFKASTLGLPRMTRELNSAKRAQVKALDRLVAEFENAERLLTEALTVIDALLKDADSAQ